MRNEQVYTAHVVGCGNIDGQQEMGFASTKMLCNPVVVSCSLLVRAF